MRWGLLIAGLVAAGTPVLAQQRPNFTGVWRLDPEASRMVGAGGRVGDAPGPESRQIAWIIAHHDPQIGVTVNVRHPGGTEEFAFACTTDGRECLNELTALNEVRRTTAFWVGDTLEMHVKAQTPRGSFETRDRLHLDSGRTVLIFDRVLTDRRGERVVRQVFRRQQSRPELPPPPRLPTVPLPAELDRVLRDYERFWREGDEAALSDLFTTDGIIARRGGFIRGRDAIREAYAGVGSDLRLRAIAYATADSVGYIVGGYGYGDAASTTDTGRFILAVRRTGGGPWLIAADLDGSNRP